MVSPVVPNDKAYTLWTETVIAREAVRKFEHDLPIAFRHGQVVEAVVRQFVPRGVGVAPEFAGALIRDVASELAPKLIRRIWRNASVRSNRGGRRGGRGSLERPNKRSETSSAPSTSGPSRRMPVHALSSSMLA